MKIPKFIKKLYLKPLSRDEMEWLYNTTVEERDRTSMSFPPMNMKQYKKMCKRMDLYH